MRDGKHWFEERVATFEPNERLAFELTACNFPIQIVDADDVPRPRGASAGGRKRRCRGSR
jgi:hypothetical protein